MSKKFVALERREPWDEAHELFMDQERRKELKKKSSKSQQPPPFNRENDLDHLTSVSQQDSNSSKRTGLQRYDLTDFTGRYFDQLDHRPS